jgi:2-polyprenyl-3-methyl-5-hydroxy-6-metoxy-1,4-benzoquinol methylase
MSPRYSARKLAEIYEREDYSDISVFENFNYEDWKQQKGFKSRPMTNYKVKGMLLDLVAQYLPTGARLLDVGCGFGLTVYEANKRGFRADGIDISQRFLKLAREKLGLTLKQGRLEDMHFPDGTYDGVICWDVLEHVHNPLEILTEIRRIVRPGGYLFGQVPNWRGLSNRYKTCLNRHGFPKKQFKHFGVPHHVFIFDEHSLRQMVEKCGLHLVYCRSWSKLKYKVSPSALQRWFYGVLEKRNLTDYVSFVAQVPSQSVEADVAAA